MGWLSRKKTLGLGAHLVVTTGKEVGFLRWSCSRKRSCLGMSAIVAADDGIK